MLYCIRYKNYNEPFGQTKISFTKFDGKAPIFPPLFPIHHPSSICEQIHRQVKKKDKIRTVRFKTPLQSQTLTVSSNLMKTEVGATGRWNDYSKLMLCECRCSRVAFHLGWIPVSWAWCLISTMSQTRIKWLLKIKWLYQWIQMLRAEYTCEEQFPMTWLHEIALLIQVIEARGNKYSVK